MSRTHGAPAFGHGGRFDYTVPVGAEDVSVSRPVGPEAVEAVRRQIADWEARTGRKAHRLP